MGLTNAQLLMLDNLIYTDYCDNGDTVNDIIRQISSDLDAGKEISSCMMTSDEWRTLISDIEKNKTLLNYQVQNYENDATTGMRAACFVDNIKDPHDVNVVFRGTCGDYEWHDNGEGGYLSDTKQQKMAAEYVNALPESYGNNMTVTGHSKGGNKAQYVTIVTDRISKCVSFDGQGFSEEFLEKYKKEISSKSGRITSISASDDFVNCLLYSIAGTKLYSETETQSDFQCYHKPNILLENGNLRSETEESQLSIFINEYTTYMISNLDEPERSATVDGLIALLESGESKESIIQTIYAGANALSHLDDFAFNYIGEHYGVGTELLLTYVAATLCPLLFMDDFINSTKETIGEITNAMLAFAEELKKRFEKFGEKAIKFGQQFLKAISEYAKKITNYFRNNFNAGYKYANSNPSIAIDTYKLRTYAQRLQAVNRRINILDSRLDRLYGSVGLKDLWNLIQADILTGYSWRISRCISYLNDTANDFDNAENSISGNL